MLLTKLTMKRFFLLLVALSALVMSEMPSSAPMGANAAPASAKKAQRQKVYMSLWGNIGETHCPDFVMEGTTGYYTLDGQERARRTLRLKSFDKKTRRCVINAYLKEKYIGMFDGVYTEDYVPEADKYVCVYQCTFISVGGANLDCYLYID